MSDASLDLPVDDACRDAVEALRRLIPIASVSARGERLQDGADAWERLLSEAGLETETWTGAGAPVVFGHSPAPHNAPTLLLYGHYDVQPADEDGWSTPPFEATVTDDGVYGRGAADNKGQLIAHVAAVRLLRERGELNVGVKFLIEGEEEIGSPNLADTVRQHREALRADLAITADAPYHDDGRPLIIFGVRGLLYIEMEVDGAATDLHSGNRGGLAPMPAWELVQALASLRDAHGHVRVPGFYHDVRSPTARELQMLRSLSFDTAAIRAEIGARRLAPAARHDPGRALMFEPTLNIAGLESGYTGPGLKTIVPAHAAAKLEARLVADQDPDRIFVAIRDHLLARCPDLRIRRLAAVPPSSTRPDIPAAAKVAAAIERATGQAPLLRPRMGGTTPDYVFTRILGIPSLLVPYGQPGMNHHAPDEHITMEALRRGVACTVEICLALARPESVLGQRRRR